MAHLDARALGVVVMGLGFITSAWSDRCEDLLKLDGLLSRAKEMGKEALCRKLLGDFPMTVKP